MAKSSPEAMAQAMIANMKQKTGKSLAQWLRVLKKSGFGKHGEIVKHLKTEYGVTHGFANLIAHKQLAGNHAPVSGEELIETQYKGAKKVLRPIYEAVIDMVCKFGQDVEVSPKKTYVSLRRNKQFAIIQASTKDRIDLGINLIGSKPGTRLEASGSFNGMVSHRVRLGVLKDVNAELKRWLQKAYDAA